MKMDAAEACAALPGIALSFPAFPPLRGGLKSPPRLSALGALQKRAAGSARIPRMAEMTFDLSKTNPA